MNSEELSEVKIFSNRQNVENKMLDQNAYEMYQLSAAYRKLLFFKKRKSIEIVDLQIQRKIIIIFDDSNSDSCTSELSTVHKLIIQ